MRVIAVGLFGTEILLDFTAPAWLALLSLMLPRTVLYRTLAACLLHESAHLLTMAVLHRRPSVLRISAAGLCLHMDADALCPTASLVCILLAGAAANGLAAAGLFLCGRYGAASANLSLALLNLLPYSATDGGTLLHFLLTQRCLTQNPERPAAVLRTVSLLTTLLFAAGLYVSGIRNPSLWGMLVFLTGGQLAAETGPRRKSRRTAPKSTRSH